MCSTQLLMLRNKSSANSYWVSVVGIIQKSPERGTLVNRSFPHVSVGWQWQTPSADNNTPLQCRKDGQGCRLSSQRFPSVTVGVTCPVWSCPFNHPS